MKIKDILQGLLSGEDFSDHGGRNEEGDRFDGPLLPILPSHANCDFCAAWRAALALLALPIAPIGEFEAGDKVFLPGRIPGRVMGTDVTVRVEVQNGEHGPWAVGSFNPLALIARDETPEFTWWRDRGGATWQRHEASQRVLLVRDEDGDESMDLSRILNGPGEEWPFALDSAEKRWGPFTQTDKP